MLGTIVFLAGIIGDEWIETYALHLKQAATVFFRILSYRGHV
jgi:hypothetical protein